MNPENPVDGVHRPTQQNRKICGIISLLFYQSNVKFKTMVMHRKRKMQGSVQCSQGRRALRRPEPFHFGGRMDASVQQQRRQLPGISDQIVGAGLLQLLSGSEAPQYAAALQPGGLRCGNIHIAVANE